MMVNGKTFLELLFFRNFQRVFPTENSLAFGISWDGSAPFRFGLAVDVDDVDVVRDGAEGSWEKNRGVRG